MLELYGKEFELKDFKYEQRRLTKLKDKLKNCLELLKERDLNDASNFLLKVVNANL